MENYITIYSHDTIYTQRKPTSKFIKFRLDGKETSFFNDLPEEIKKLVTNANDMVNNPDKYFEYDIIDDKVEITKINAKSKYIKIPDKIKGYPVTTIGRTVALNIRNSAEQIQLPETITEISEGAFLLAKKLKIINIPLGVKTIKANSFSTCEKLSQINLEHVTSIESNAFNNCYELRNIKLNNIKSLGFYCFSCCTKLKSVEINGELTTIPSNAFSYCNSLNELKLPDTIKKIDKEAFYSCLIKEFIAPEKLEEIGEYAFCNNNMKTLKLNNNIKYIHKTSFSSNGIKTLENPTKIHINIDEPER